ncbi:hypothetical protein QCA50_010934 [Cerrena zonata]|uniref:Uncharacterized protein n=1 Tax=Cerrena zonata TaxID=2478898 RepID=A0AAW0G158_9APHY
MDQAELGVGRPMNTNKFNKQILSPSGKTLQIAEMLPPLPKKRKAAQAILTPDNAEGVIRNAFDLTMFSKSLARQPETVQDLEALIRLMTQCVIDQTIVPFSSVTKRHLKLLGLDLTYRMSLDPDAALDANENSPSNRTLEADAIDCMQKHFNVSMEAGCRSIIGQFLIAAVVYAQEQIDTDSKLQSSLRRTYKIMKPHISVFSNLHIPHTTITCDSDNVSYTFHGVLDYAIGFIEADDILSLGRGSIGLDAHEILCGIAEVNSLSEMQDAVPQITAQALTLLALGEKKNFTCALTNGALWRFFTAYNKDEHIKIYMSPEFAAQNDKGIIIEWLSDMILCPISPMVATKFDEEVEYK